MEIIKNFLPGIFHFHIQAFSPRYLLRGEIWHLRTRCPEVNKALMVAGSQLLPVLPGWLPPGLEVHSHVCCLLIWG